MCTNPIGRATKWPSPGMGTKHRAVVDKPVTKGLTAFPRFSRMESDQVTYYSVDLSSATDRFPFAMQKKVMSVVFGDSLAGAWEDIMIKYPFKCPGADSEDPVFYRAGQPMGAYTSFPAFALTHHVLIRALARRKGVKPRYAVLGDDVVIAGDTLGTDYLDSVKTLGVPFSLEKTFISKEMFEFAKRIL